jgi:hypothetical protein
MLLDREEIEEAKKPRLTRGQARQAQDTAIATTKPNDTAGGRKSDQIKVMSTGKGKGKAKAEKVDKVEG